MEKWHSLAAGIGLATAEAFANAGASVVLADLDEERIGKAAEGLSAAGSQRHWRHL